MEQLRGRGKNAAKVLLALTAALLATVILLLLFAFLLLMLQPDTGKTRIGICLIYVISCFIGGWSCGRRMGHRKFLWGLLLGVLYFLLLLSASGIGGEILRPEPAKSVLILALCAGGGMLGGMLA